MPKIYTSIDELVGNTPILELKKFKAAKNLYGNILAKLECFNPAGSIKDRAALEILNTASKDGRLNKDTIIIEPTSGNTGIGLAAIAASRGLKLIITMPETMSMERRKLMQSYGAKLVLTEGAKGMAGAIEKAQELADIIPNSIIAGQFSNPANPAAHYKTTGPEIWDDTNGEVDFLVAGVGTGGTITGAGKYLKEKLPNIQIIAVEPYSSAVLSGESKGPHGLQGIGAGFIPQTLDTEIYDEIVKVTEDEAYCAGRDMAKLEGILIGISSGAALHAASIIASKPQNKNKNIVTILPDTGERYLSTPMFCVQ